MIQCHALKPTGNEKDGQQESHERRLREMFWSKKPAKDEGKLSGPREIPGPVQAYMVAEKKMDPNLVKLLKAVERRGASESAPNIRIFDNSEAIARKVQVKDYTSLDEAPGLIIFEGWLDGAAKQVKLEEKNKFNWNTPILTQEEIQQKIEALKQPGETVFFYAARGGKAGGPLGMGAFVVELNPDFPGKKQKKYTIYTTDVTDMQPVGKGDKLFQQDKSKDVARWIKDAHHKREY
jgi:hypothetical protein